MPLPSETALKGRARTMLEAMTARERWVYAVPPEGAREHASRALEPLGLTKTPGDAQDRYERAGATVLVAEAPDLDVAFVVPGTNIRYGIDGLIGLVPVIGDIITTAISLWLVREARALGAPWHITARMLGNVAFDGVIGLVPVVGDAVDIMFRANIRNVRMLKRWLDKQPKA